MKWRNTKSYRRENVVFVQMLKNKTLSLVFNIVFVLSDKKRLSSSDLRESIETKIDHLLILLLLERHFVFILKLIHLEKPWYTRDGEENFSSTLRKDAVTSTLDSNKKYQYLMFCYHEIIQEVRIVIDVSVKWRIGQTCLLNCDAFIKIIQQQLWHLRAFIDGRKFQWRIMRKKEKLHAVVWDTLMLHNNVSISLSQ